MGFSSALQGRAAHDALLNRQEAELKLLETMKRCLAQKAKCDREYAVSLAAVTQQGLKIDRTDDLQGSHIMRAWRGFMEELEHTAKQIRSNAEQLETVCHEKLASLYQEKRRVRKQYQEEHTKIATQFSHLTEDVARKKSEYQKHLDYYKLLRGRFEEHIKSGRSGRKLDDVIDKYQKACRKLHQAHNEYVLLISEAVEVEKDFRTTLLPGLLEHQQTLQEGFIQAWSNLLSEIAKLSDTTSEKYVEIQRRIDTSISSINSTEEYREFTDKHKTSPTTPVVFQFDESLVEDSLGKLQANTLTVDNLTVDWLRGRQVELEGTIKDLQERQAKLLAEPNGTGTLATSSSPASSSPVSTPGTKPSTPILNGTGNSNGASGKDSQQIAANKSSKELNNLRCQERQTMKLVEMIRTALNEVGCEELPSGCDDIAVEHLIENKKSVSQDLSLDSQHNNPSQAGGFFTLRTGNGGSGGGGGGGGGGGVMSMLIDQLRRKSGPPGAATSGGTGGKAAPRSVGTTPAQTPKPGHRATAASTVNSVSSPATITCERVQASLDGFPPHATNHYQQQQQEQPQLRPLAPCSSASLYAELRSVNPEIDDEQSFPYPENRISNVYVDMEAYLGMRELSPDENSSEHACASYTNINSDHLPSLRHEQSSTAHNSQSSPMGDLPNSRTPMLGDDDGERRKYRRLRTMGDRIDDEDDDADTAEELNDSKNNLLREESYDGGDQLDEGPTESETKYLTMRKRSSPRADTTTRWKSSIEQHLDVIDALNIKLDEHQRLSARLSEDYEYIRVQTLRREAELIAAAAAATAASSTSSTAVPQRAAAGGTPFEKANSFREKIKRRIRGAKSSQLSEPVEPETPDKVANVVESFSGRLRTRIASQRQFRLMKETDSASPSTDRGSITTNGGASNSAGGRQKKKKRKSSKAHRAFKQQQQQQQQRSGLKRDTESEQEVYDQPQQLLHPANTFSEDELLVDEPPRVGSPEQMVKPSGQKFSQTVRATWRELLHSTNKVKDSSINLTNQQQQHDRMEEKLDLIPNQDRPGLLAIRFTFSDTETPEHHGSRQLDATSSTTGEGGEYCVPLLLSQSSDDTKAPQILSSGDSSHPAGSNSTTSKLAMNLKINLKERLTKLVHKRALMMGGGGTVPGKSNLLPLHQPSGEICRSCSKRIVRPGTIHPSQTVLDFVKEFPGLDICNGGHDEDDENDDCDGDGDNKKADTARPGRATESEMINLEYEDIDVITIKSHKLTDHCEGGDDDNDDDGMTLSTNRPLHEEEWFHGVLPREEVVRLLRNEGDFLVRETTRNDESQTVLSVCWNGHKHFIVQTTAEGHYRFEGPAFPSIQELIVHQYQSELPVTGRSGAVLRKPVLRERWELSNDDVILLDKIGRGNFGDVYKAKLKSSKNTLVAVKTCRMTLPEEQKRKFLQEGRILKQYDHPNIVKLIGICVQKQPIMIVMELVAGGSLLMFLRKNATTLGQRQMMGMCRDAAAGMRYLESKNCIHRDLAARNCLIGSENIVKISDFGMSREEEEYIVSGGMKQIPIKWTAPEALNFGKYTSLCDVWSYGILVWEIFSRGDTPYSGMSNSMARERIDEGYRMPSPEGAPPEMYRLMLKCWSYEPESRPHFDEIYTVVDALILCTKD
ncbi:tyrosine-protein kinase Fer isoform X1 [Anopheles aquasalis]|uniref:tyrosine-protein kinase Fer isoform X1 n=1 Tax=Anopheles aquasalis TaxID=42839 RepID=UPI00215A23EA|nr:tyrosine-protein kinase Fer isoform X1 [Anopheles aquasalis]